eukprot:1127455-Prymnesium_polylepis.1
MPTSAGSCNVTLRRQLSGRSPCTLGTSFGCWDSATVWVRAGCRGLFALHPHGKEVACGWAVAVNHPYATNCSVRSNAPVPEKPAPLHVPAGGT